MDFDKIKNLQIGGSMVYKFDDYTLYFISPNKFTHGISPILDNIIDKEYSFIQCKRGMGSIGDKYIYKILNKENVYMFFLTKTITSKKDVWEPETLDDMLVDKLKKLEFTKENYTYLRFLILYQLKELGVKTFPGMPFKQSSFIKKIFDTRREQSIDAIKAVKSKSQSLSLSQIGAGMVNKKVTEEFLISFMFVEKMNDSDYYIRVRCTSDNIDFDEEHTYSNPKPEYKFPWSTYFLYVFLKSFGNKSINLYNHASEADVTYYHKRFLFNLGKKDCKEDDPIYNESVLIPFNIIKGPTKESKEMFSDLLKSLPETYKTSSGYKMKVCDIQSPKNSAKIDDVETYLAMKWGNSFGDKKIDISSKKLLYPRSAFKTKKSLSKARSLSLNHKSYKTQKSQKSKFITKSSNNKSGKKTKKISYRRSA